MLDDSGEFGRIKKFEEKTPSACYQPTNNVKPQAVFGLLYAAGVFQTIMLCSTIFSERIGQARKYFD